VQDAIAAKRVYGEPAERDGVTVIPAVFVRGGGGAALAILTGWSLLRRRR
jgi:hypothetical protein